MGHGAQLLSGLESGLSHTMPAVIRHVARVWGDKPFIVDEDGSITSFAAFERLVAGVGARLIDLGIGTGDVVAILAPNSSGWIVAACAIESIGAIMVPINTRFKGPEVRYVLERARVSALFTVGDFLGTNYARIVIDACGGPGDVRPIADLPHLKALIRLDTPGFAPDHLDKADRARFDAAAATVTPDTTIDLMFTSGTTGMPKGAMHGHGQALWMTALWTTANGLNSDDRMAIINPFFHTFGYRAGWASALISGMTMWPVSTFDAGAMLKLIERGKITQLSGAPTVFFSLMQHPDFGRRNLSSLRSGHTGGAKTPPDIIRAGYEKLGFNIFLTSYGLTETTGIISTNHAGDPIDAIINTVGRPSPMTDVQIIDTAGNVLPQGERGELIVRGPSVMQGYFDDPEQTAKTIIAGWLHTGDVAMIDDDGRLRIVDRLKDVVIVGGFNAYPVEIELMMAEHPDIAEVAIIGIPDDRMGEVTAACIIPRAGVTMDLSVLTQWCRERMANYKVPRHLFVTDALPRTRLGKVQKFELTKQVLDQVSLRGDKASATKNDGIQDGTGNGVDPMGRPQPGERL